MPSGGIRSWTDEKIEAEIRLMAEAIGHFPSNTELKGMGRTDLADAISKYGGFVGWSEKLGIPRKHSDSDTGWAGEISFAKLCIEQSLTATRSAGVKAPFDLMVNSVLRVDVKTAKYAEYRCGINSMCRGWFYRLGKVCQADLVVFYQLDTGNFYGLPWYSCTTSNITIARDGGKYAPYLNNWLLVRKMIDTRTAEKAAVA